MMKLSTHQKRCLIAALCIENAIRKDELAQGLPYVYWHASELGRAIGGHGLAGAVRRPTLAVLTGNGLITRMRDDLPPEVRRILWCNCDMYLLRLTARGIAIAANYRVTMDSETIRGINDAAASMLFCRYWSQADKPRRRDDDTNDDDDEGGDDQPPAPFSDDASGVINR